MTVSPPRSQPNPGPDDGLAALEPIARQFIDGYNARDLERMLAVCAPEVVYYPSRIHGLGVFRGLEGIREFWRETVERAIVYEVSVQTVRLVDRRLTNRRGDVRGSIGDRNRPVGMSGSEPPRRGDRRSGGSSVALLGELRSDGHSLGPWATVFVIRDGQIVECRGYLTPGSMLAELGIVRDSDR